MCKELRPSGNRFRIIRRKSAGCTRIVCLCGLFFAIVLGIAGSCVIRNAVRNNTESKQRLIQMDQKAQSLVKKAKESVPEITTRICKPKNLATLCWYMALDKVRKTDRAERYLKEQLSPVTDTCSRIAQVYGVGADDSGTIKNILNLGKRYLTGAGYSVSSLTLEAVFLKSTMESLKRILAVVVGRMSSSIAAGGTCAAIDGPMLFGDILGVAMAAGGTAWSAYDLWQISKSLPEDLCSILYESIDAFHNACRMEAVK